MRWRRVGQPWVRAIGRWRQDTISKRLFLLLWVTLVLSHVLVVAFLLPGLGPARPEVQRLVLPPFLPPHAWGGEPSDHHPGPGMAPWPAGPGWQEGHGPSGALQGKHQGPVISPWLDYGARVLVLGLGAWLGARWLTTPMRKLATASRSLSRAITRRGDLPLMDERSGPVEVRQTAEVFNNMARHLHEQFEQRSLMMASVSHDLRTPLTRLRMRLERLQPDPEVARCVADVHDINAMIDAHRPWWTCSRWCKPWPMTCRRPASR